LLNTSIGSTSDASTASTATSHPSKLKPTYTPPARHRPNETGLTGPPQNPGHNRALGRLTHRWEPLVLDQLMRLAVRSQSGNHTSAGFHSQAISWLRPSSPNRCVARSCSPVSVQV
jgi:hypothetical protein